MSQMKGPAIFLAQFAGDEAPFNSLDAICKWVSGLGYKGIQIPSWDARLFDLDKAAQSQDYCDEVKGLVASYGMEITELSTHLQGQLVAVHPAYDAQFDGFAAEHVRGNPKARQEWAVQQVKEQHANFGAFRVPSLRNVANTGPYMHNGSLLSLDAVALHYSNIDLERLHADGELILQPLNLTAMERSDLVEFLHSLTAPVVGMQ